MNIVDGNCSFVITFDNDETEAAALRQRHVQEALHSACYWASTALLLGGVPASRLPCSQAASPAPRDAAAQRS